MARISLVFKCSVSPLLGALFAVEVSGILGYLVIFSLYFFISGKENSKYYEIFLISLLLSFAILFLVSFSNTYLYNTRIDVQQLIDLFIFSSSFLATLGIARVASYIQNLKHCNLLSLIFVCFVTVYGLNSYLVMMNNKANEYRSYSPISSSELEAINFLDNYFKLNKDAVLVSSNKVPLAASPPSYLKEGSLLFSSNTPRIYQPLTFSRKKKSCCLHKQRRS